MIYIDNDFKCHTTNTTGDCRSFEVMFFKNKCKIFIEGYRYIPDGEEWTRSDGMKFNGEMITPWKPYSELDTAQREYEKQLLKEQAATIAELDAALLDAQYQNLIGG